MTPGDRVDGQQQRKAFSAAETAIASLGAAQPLKAKRNAHLAVDLDQIGAFTGLPRAVEMGIHDIEQTGAVSGAVWDRLAVLVGDGPLRALIDHQRDAVHG
jgi:hypothetical protein